VSLNRARGDKDETAKGRKERATGASQAWAIKQIFSHIHSSDW
jgi:hypothetical protein